ncbi:DUF6184 family natural product biosynthesis lipoprotein [Polyangium spumosum]|uniref:Uncharacterized protein n=1 Tax=Polyangium spumosum TaxID=889282 RepID=A0A6N7Q0A5_9BACT|nr:DUF6184 family natural product biosynthesis lipoprotein [Polyangium spumosum]MRG96576.1 hypothetical protein [Polyangium spumosum]
MSESLWRTIRCIGLFAACSAAAVGCSREDRALGTERGRELGAGETTTPAPVPGASAALAGAVDSIAAATCDHAQRCGEIGMGDDKDYASRDACLARERQKLSEDLNTTSCRGGIHQKELDECLAEARNQDCNAPFDALGKIAACRTSDICNAVP